MPRLPGSMLVIAAPAWSLMRVMWYSNGPGKASNCHPNSEPQNWRPLAVSSAGISKCTGWPGIAPPCVAGAAEAWLRHGRSASIPRQASVGPGGRLRRAVDVDGGFPLAGAHHDQVGRLRRGVALPVHDALGDVDEIPRTGRDGLGAVGAEL